MKYRKIISNILALLILTAFGLFFWKSFWGYWETGTVNDLNYTSIVGKDSKDLFRHGEVKYVVHRVIFVGHIGTYWLFTGTTTEEAFKNFFTGTSDAEVYQQLQEENEHFLSDPSWRGHIKRLQLNKKVMPGTSKEDFWGYKSIKGKTFEGAYRKTDGKFILSVSVRYR